MPSTSLNLCHPRPSTRSQTEEIISRDACTNNTHHTQAAITRSCRSRLIARRTFVVSLLSLLSTQPASPLFFHSSSNSLACRDQRRAVRAYAHSTPKLRGHRRRHRLSPHGQSNIEFSTKFCNCEKKQFTMRGCRERDSSHAASQKQSRSSGGEAASLLIACVQRPLVRRWLPFPFLRFP